MYNELKKLFAFVEKELRILFSYTFGLLQIFFEVFSIGIPLLIVGKMFGIERLNILEPYGGNYTYYLITGIIGWEFLLSIAMGGYMGLVNEMAEGTLESLLVTPTSIFVILIGSMVSGALIGLISAALLIIIGVLFFKVYLTINTYLLLIIFFSFLSMIGLGFIFAGLTLKFKMITPLFSLVQLIAALGSGVYFPLEALPPIFKYMGYLIPTYHSIMGLRIALLPEVPSSLIFRYITIICLFSIFLLIVGVKSVKWGLSEAKREGSLSFF